MSGGFMLENESQNVDSPSKPRMGFGPQSLKPVTIKQLQEAAVNPDGRLVVDNQELSHFSLISCVRGIKEGSTGTDYFIEDGTASITARCWPDKNIAPAKEGDWVQVFGTFKNLGSTKSVNVTFHFLETIAANLACSDPAFLTSAKNSSRKEPKLSSAPQYEDQSLTPIQKAVYSLYRECSDEIGVNVHVVIRALYGRYSENDVRSAVSSLIADGLIYLTIDGDHARNISEEVRMKKIKSSEESLHGLYAHFRDLGLVCDDIKPSFQFRGGVGFVTCSIGYTFHIYSLEKLELAFVGPAFPQKITALTAYNDFTFVAAGNSVYIVDRNIIVAVIEMKKEAISTLAVFGDILVGSGESSIYLFDLKTNALMHCEHFENEYIVDFFHPETYLNKIIIALSNGDLILFNIKSKKAIHTFSEFSGETITCICGSPDPDILALGLITGSVVFFEFKKGQRLFSLRIDGSVTALTFRTDELAHLAVGSSLGDVQVFDLDSHKLEHIISIHSKAVASLFFVPQQPLLVSTSCDNSIKEYLFESSEYRCLRQRSGHYKPPKNIRFYGDDSRFLVSAGSDRSVRFSSIFKDNQNFEFSQGSVQKIASKLKTSEEDVKLPEVSEIDIFEVKTLKWDNMITSHAGQTYAKTWRFDRKTIGQHSLETTDKSIVSHISISSCGNFGILSTRTGFIDIFNLQSGIRRKNIKAFNGSKIIASFTDATNSLIISVSEDGKLNTFDFSKGTLLNTIELESSALNATINKDTELIAVACSDNVIRVIDFSSMRLVRIFNGHSAQIQDIVFSADSKWLVSCALDKTIRTWDMSSGNLADILTLEKVPTALALSRNLEFLASCHQDEISISIWSNRSLYTGDCNIIESAINWSNFKSETVPSDSNEIQYSEFPASRWKNIYFLDKIRNNTKPTDLSSKKRTALPFFLTQILEQDKMDLEAEVEPNNNSQNVTTDGEFSESLANFNSEGNTSECFNFLKNLHPSKLDFEISCLSDDYKTETINFILNSLNSSIVLGHDFEIVNAVLSLVLRHHEEYICAHSESFKDIMHRILGNIKDKWQPLENLMQSTICLVSFTREL